MIKESADAAAAQGAAVKVTDMTDHENSDRRTQEAHPSLLVKTNGCPHCGGYDGLVIDRPSFWSVCDAHRTRWNTVWNEPEPVLERVEGNLDRLSYQVVKPVHSLDVQAWELLNDATRTLERLGNLLSKAKALGMIAVVGNKVRGRALRAAAAQLDRMFRAQKVIIDRCTELQEHFFDATGADDDIPF
jgi:hypothetical protein